MASRRQLLWHWAEQGKIPPEHLDAALRYAEVQPSGAQWRQFLDRLLLWSGILSLASGIIFFLAFNWDELGRFGKFALVEAAMVAALVVYLRLPDSSRVGSALLFGLALLTGALLALFGQTYQTGADTWQLFATWALFVTPLALLGRTVVLWVLWVLLANLALVLYLETFRPFWFLYEIPMLALILWGFNSLVQLVWELAALRWTWLGQRWAVRLPATFAGIAITWLVVLQIIDYPFAGSYLVAYALWLAALYACYRYWIKDLFMLAGFCLSLITSITVLLAEYLFSGHSADGSLLLALVVIGLSTASALWLKRINQEQLA